MNILSLVATHSDVDLETIACLSAGSSEVGASVLDEAHPVSGAVVLATCNRYEIYCELPPSGEADAGRAAMIRQISRASGISEDVVSRTFTVNTGTAVAEHLFAVAAGLDSAVVGEREIAGQVRRALIEAQQRGTASGALTRLFQSASRTAKDVGSQTALGARGLSIVSVALELAADLASDRDWSGKKVVVFGTGAYAGATMSLLQQRGCTAVSVYSSSGRADEFATSRGGAALTDETVGAALAAADVIIGCSGGDTKVEAAQIQSLRADVAKPLTIIDLALTRDFDPAVADLDGVDLITLESVRLAAPHEQVESLSQAHDIVASAARSFDHQQQARSVDTAIVALRKHTHKVLESELDRVRAQHGCTAAAEEVEFALRRMVKQLLHIPTVRGRELAKNGEQDSYIAALEALYGITVEEPPAADVPAGTSSPAGTGSPVGTVAATGTVAAATGERSNGGAVAVTGTTSVADTTLAGFTTADGSEPADQSCPVHLREESA